MDFVGPHRYTCLLQQSLIEARIGDMSKIIDTGTVTILNSENLAYSEYIAYAHFDRCFRGAGFLFSDPEL